MRDVPVSSELPRVDLSVLNGPDAGLHGSYRQGSISIGRSPISCFRLTDGYVSNRHGQILLDGDAATYRDLDSRHGSRLKVDGSTTKLHGGIRELLVSTSSDVVLHIGATVIKVAFVHAGDPPLRAAALPVPAGSAGETGGPDRGRILVAARTPGEAAEDPPRMDPRVLGVMLRLTQGLNTGSTLDEHLACVADAVFDALPATRHLSVALAEEVSHLERRPPVLVRDRRDPRGDPPREGSVRLRLGLLQRAASSGHGLLRRNARGRGTRLCAPLVGQRGLSGALQVTAGRGGPGFSVRDLELLSVIAFNAGCALERARQSVDQSDMLDAFVQASVSAIEARDPGTAGHSQRVATYVVELAEEVNRIEAGRLADVILEPEEIKELRYAALLHDFGKIAVREEVLRKGQRVGAVRMELIRQRFETIKALESARLLEGMCRKRPRPDGEEPPLKEIRARVNQFSRRLDRIFRWLQEVSAAEVLQPEQIARVRRIARCLYQDGRGDRLPLLTAEEGRDLCIPAGTLNAEEWADMQAHAARSRDFLELIPWTHDLTRVPCIAGAHHELLDGSGYPAGLAGEQVIPQMRMLTIVDIFDALTAADRPYRRAAPIHAALRILRRDSACDKLDADMVEVFATRVVPRLRSDLLAHQPSW